MEYCNKNCVYYFLKQINDESTGKLFTMIENSIHDISSLKHDDSNITKMFTRLFDYLSAIQFIHCEIGMFYLEKYFMSTAYKTIFYKESETNMFINNKMILFQWIEPIHIDLPYKPHLFFSPISHIRKLNTTFTPTEKLNCIMATIKSLYTIIGIDQGQDKLFPTLVYTLIKSKLEDLYLNYRFLKTFTRSHYKQCIKDCIHLGDRSNKDINTCNCLSNLLTNDQKKEMDYYLITFHAAIKYIERIEYQNLNISKETFDLEVSKVIHHIKRSPFKLIKIKKSYFNILKNKIKNLIQKTFNNLNMN